MKPNYNHCLLNLISSIEKHFGYSSQFASLPEVDKLLNNKQHIFLILLDGLGSKLIEHHLPKRNFLRKHQIDVLSSLFPPTTVAVTTAVLSNKLPDETGWFGWHQYFKQFDRHVVMFRNLDYYSNENLSFSATETLPYQSFFAKYQNIETKILMPSFIEDGHKTFNSQIKEMIAITAKKAPTFTYAYWNEPDYSIHEYGCKHDIVKRKISDISKQLAFFKTKLPADSLAIVIADHGLLDIETININNYPEIVNCFDKKPSLEGRCATFSVKNDGDFSQKKFSSLFNKEFGKYFELYTKEQFLKSGYLYNQKANKLDDFLFDYIAVAIDKYAFDFLPIQNERFPLKAHHAGATEDELLVPLIVF